MRFKLDENFGGRIKSLFVKDGYDTSTVIEQELGGADDKTIYEFAVMRRDVLLALILIFRMLLDFHRKDAEEL